MRTYEEKLTAAANEVHEKRVFWSKRPPKTPRIWILLYKTFGWELPSFYHMSFWQIFVYYGTIVGLIKLVFDYFFFSNAELMVTNGYWQGFVFFVLFQSFFLAGFFRGISRWYKLSRWEDL